MPYIAFRSGDNKWQFVEAKKYQKEESLRNLIVEEPRLLPQHELGIDPKAQIVSLREMGLPGAGASDVILIDSDGGITIVECKLATNPEKKRAVIGQVLDYASSLSLMSYDALDARCREVQQAGLHEIMQKNVQADQWDEDRFRQDVTDTLRAGRFRLVIAIDEMDPDLARILDYMSSQSRGTLHIFGLEMRYHKTHALEAVVPHIANPLTEGPLPSPQWDADRFRNELQRINDEQVRTAALDMVDFALHNDSLSWGHDQGKGSFGYRIRPGGKPISLFSYYTDGTIYLNLGNLQKKVAPEVFNQFVESVAALRGFERAKTSSSGWPSFQTRDTLVDGSNRERFKEAVENLKRAISNPASS